MAAESNIDGGESLPNLILDPPFPPFYICPVFPTQPTQPTQSLYPMSTPYKPNLPVNLPVSL